MVGRDDTSSEDPYLYLEEVESEESLNFAQSANEKCLKALGDPNKSDTGTYDRVLAALESDERIPYCGQYGHTEAGEPLLLNFWKDSKNPKGIWRKTTMQSYRSENPEWSTILDVDELSEKDDISWVWKGSMPLARARDPFSDNGQRVTRSLLSLSRGGSDAVHIKEFDLLEGDFVTEDPFVVSEAKTRISYKSRDVVLVGTDFGEESLTDSGYPRTVREWVRGTNIEDAPVVFEGEKTDVSVSAHVYDQRHRGGPIYEVHARTPTFYTAKKWVRTVQFEHLLAPDDPKRQNVEDAGDFVELDVQDDASAIFVGNMLIVHLRSDWEPVPRREVYKQGSVLYVDANDLLSKGKEACTYNVVFEPTDRTAIENYIVTKNYFVLSLLDNVKSKLEFYKIEESGSALRKVGGDSAASIQSSIPVPVDAYGSDEFWLTTSGYTQPSTLYLASCNNVGSQGGQPEKDCLESYIQDKIKSLPSQYDSSDMEVTQGTATSKDGTKVPYFLVKKKGIAMDGNTPTLLYGYGGFEIALRPHYIATGGIAWLERGGAYVEANIRGGGEFGPQWHQAALKGSRNKSYEDFIAVAEHLVSQKLCKPSKLAARGGSNGGLLMGNMYTTRPDLFGAIHCAVPLLDMKRYHILLAGSSWMAEYGDPDTSDWDDFLHKYSPYHNIDPNKKYPPILFTTSTRDDRVHPGHARKMVKKLWDLDKSWPVYYYENIEGGHGGAADAKQSAFMTSLAFDFMWDTLVKDVD